MANQTNLRIARDIGQIQKGDDLSLAVACDEADIRHVRALVIGPPGTPYEYGFFEFISKFGAAYPTEPPKVEAITTNKGRTRFNPNIYAGGKVCLSILGTWHGERGEEWSSAQGLESILLSIQSLMSNNPYENEPGYENNKSDEDKKQQEHYCAKIRHETIRIAVLQKLESMLHIQADGSVKPPSDDDDDEDDSSSSDEAVVEDGAEKASRGVATRERMKNWDPFRDLQKRRFLWYYESYLSTIEKHTPKHTEGQRFEMMQFEGSSNEMAGTFRYRDLARRLIRVREVLDEETASWAVEGLKATERESTVAYTLQGQFTQINTYFKQRDCHNVDVTLDEGNPFVWILTYFGKSGTNLDGGVFCIKISLSPQFPQEQPRVKVETKIFHHRVSKHGVLCYFPKRTDEVKYHVEAVIQALEEESPPFDPRTIVHPEATSLLWGTEDEKKKYGRQQRRSAQDSMEEAMV